MINIYDKKTTNFNNLGLCTLVPTSCVVNEELNGIYELTLEHEYDILGKWKNIENQNIIVVSVPTGRQAFRIYNIKFTMESIKVNAKHIFFDLNDNLILSKNGKLTAKQFINNLKNELFTDMPFTFNTDVNTDEKDVNILQKTPVYALLSDDEDVTSFINLYNGEIKRNNFEIEMLNNLGKDRGFQIRYKKNLLGLSVTEDASEITTKILPISGEIAGDYVESQYINNYPYIKFKIIEFQNVSTISELNEKAKNFFENGIDLPKINIKINFILLSQTEEYKEFVHLEKVFLGDIVTIINEKMNFFKKAKVIEYEWDCILNRYNSIELGDFKNLLTTIVTTSVQNTDIAINANLNANNAVVAANNIQKLINGNITITEDFLYLPVDNTNYKLAKKLYRIGKNGIEYSVNGFNGEYSILLNGK